MREEVNKISQSSKSRTVYLHGAVLIGKSYTMLVIIYIWGKLELPWLIVEGDGNSPQSLPCRTVGIAWMTDTLVA